MDMDFFLWLHQDRLTDIYNTFLNQAGVATRLAGLMAAYIIQDCHARIHVASSQEKHFG